MNREIMGSCELCFTQASAYCESDRASLCWNCDAKVHGANFLVARHSRTLLCHSCQSHTPWKACGAKLGNTVSFCETCTGGTEDEESGGGTDDDVGTDNGTDVEDDEEEEEEDEYSDDVDQFPENGDSSDEDEDEEHDEACGVAQDGDHDVVPLSRTSPLPPSSNSPSSHESAYRSGDDGDCSESVSAFSIKRMRENASDLHLQENPASSSGRRYDIEWMKKSAVHEEMLRPLKARRSGTGGSSIMQSSYRIV